MSGSMDSIIDDPKDKRLSGIGQIFGGKKYEKSRAKCKSCLNNLIKGTNRHHFTYIFKFFVFDFNPSFVLLMFVNDFNSFFTEFNFTFIISI